MKKLFNGFSKKVLLGIISLAGVLGLMACDFGNGEVVLPDFPEANADSDSWEQWKSYDDSVIDVSWYVDNPSFNFNMQSMVSSIIKEKTGINIQFQTPSTADGSKLSTMISNNQLTDLVTVAANTPDRIKLTEDGSYLYSINDLANKWAPTLSNRLDEEMKSYYNASDGKLYGIPSLFYSLDDLEEMQEINSTYLSNGAIVARKDYLDAYHDHMRSTNSNWDESSVATPQGILDMCLWVKNEFNLDASNPTVALSPFESHRTHGSVGLRWLMEYFSVPQEDKDGNYLYQWATPEFKEMMVWLNSLFRNKLMTTGNMTATGAQVGTYISNGLPFIYIGSPQDYVSNFKYWALRNPKGEDARYVPIIFSNSAGTVPQLSVTGNSYMFTMVSQNCERPDRVIKLLDYLYSEEGQRMMTYGKLASGPDDENGTYYYVVEPGGEATLENGEKHVFKYGQIDYTNEVKQALNNNETSNYGFFGPSISQNGAYPYLSNINHGLLYNYNNYINYNLKAALKPFTYIYRGFEFEMDVSSKDYMTAINIESQLRLLWMDYYAEIICSKTEASARSLIDDTLASANRRNVALLIAVKDASFKAHKQRYNLLFASPINDPNNEYYKSLRITSVYADTSYEKEIPAYIEKK